jgi:hypothetical protein
MDELVYEVTKSKDITKILRGFPFINNKGGLEKRP